jgi:ligand-binding sensor domain-containing protein
MNSKIRLWVVLLLLFADRQASAQNAPYAFFRNYTTEQGLPSERIRSLAQDAEGYIWVGTNAGLSRFDGISFETFQKTGDSDKGSLASDNIVKLEATKSHRIWVGHYEAGLDLFNTQTAKVELHLGEIKGELPNNRITDIFDEESKNRVWISTIRNMWVWYDIKQKKVIIPSVKSHNHNSLPLPATNSVYDVLKDPNIAGQYWLATNDGLGLYNERDNTLRYFYFDEGKSGTNTDDRLRSLVWKNNQIYIGIRGSSGLIRFDPVTYKYLKFPASAEGNLMVADVAVKSENELWIGSLNHSLGIYNLGRNSYTFFKSDPNFKFSVVEGSAADMLVDKSGNLWFATVKGLSHWSMSNQKFRFIPFNDDFSDTNKPLTFCDDNEHIYVGLSNTHGLPVYSKANGLLTYVLPDENPVPRLSFQRFAKDTSGTLFMIASGSLYMYFSGRLTKVEMPLELREVQLHSLIFGADNSLFLGSRFDGLFKWNLSSGSVKQLSQQKGNLVHNRYLHEMLFDTQGKLWVGTEKGISVVNPETFKTIKNIASVHNLKVVYRMTQDMKGNIWVTTESQGVYAFDYKTFNVFKHLTKKDGLPSDAIQHIAADNSGDIWISTQRGLCRYHSVEGEMEVFTLKNGLVENQLEASLNALEGGYMVQGYDTGFALFKPSDIDISNVPDKPKITSFEIFDKRIAPASFIQVNADENFFSIRFSSIEFTQPHLIEYAYRLVGLNEDWIYTSTHREVQYNKVRFGNYTFQVKARMLGSAQWSDITEINIHVSPPFYFKWWFLLTVFTILFLSGYFWYRSRIENVKKEERKAAEVKRRVFASELRALRSQMNPHFLYNCINSIKYFVVTNDTPQASIFLSKFAKLMRRILNNSQHEFISLDDEIQTLKLYLEMEQLRFSERMKFEMHVDSDLNISTTEIPTMLVQPYIENAIWHGLMQKKTDDGLIKLSFDCIQSDRLQIQIRDNGIGRKQAAEVKSRSVEKNKSMGMEMTQARIDNLNEINNLDIETSTEDLIDAEGNATGTLVTITMKIK